MVIGLISQIQGLNISGAALVMVAPVILLWVNLLRSQTAQALTRIDDLEKKLAPFQGPERG